jgi:membrane protease YdiL (CAAX protease family)
MSMSTRTWLITAALGALLAFLTYRLIVDRRPLASLERPVETTVRVQERNLLVQHGADPRWQALRSVFAGDRPDERVAAVLAYREALAVLDRKPAINAPSNARAALRGRLAILLLESGRLPEAQTALDGLDGEGAPGQECAGLIRAVYAPAAVPGWSVDAGWVTRVRELLAIPGTPVPAWTTGRFTARLFRRLGDPEQAAAAEGALQAAAAQYGARATAVAAAFYVTLLLGAACLAGMALRRRWFLPVADGEPRAPWTLLEGWGVLVRGLFLALVVAIFGLQVLRMALGLETLPLADLFAAVPLLILLDRRLLAPAALDGVTVFGLRPHAPVRALVTAALGLLTIRVGATVALGLTGRTLGVAPPWSDTIDEGLIIGSAPAVASRLLDYVALRPALEELACRGLLYASLRTRLGPWAAALASAGIFALLFVYQPLSFLVLFTSGVASALVYERTRSLWPGIIAHALGNALALAVEPLLYR